MKNIKIELTIATGKSYENCHLSAEVETLDEAMEFAVEAEEKFHNCFMEKDIVENAGVRVEQKPVKGGSEKEVTFEKVDTSIPKEEVLRFHQNE